MTRMHRRAARPAGAGRKPCGEDIESRSGLIRKQDRFQSCRKSCLAGLGANRAMLSREATFSGSKIIRVVGAWADCR